MILELSTATHPLLHPLPSSSFFIFSWIIGIENTFQNVNNLEFSAYTSLHWYKNVSHKFHLFCTNTNTHSEWEVPKISCEKPGCMQLLVCVLISSMPKKEEKWLKEKLFFSTKFLSLNCLIFMALTWNMNAT